MRLRWLLVFALCSAAAPALRAQSFTEFCRSVRVVRLGQWAEYDVAGGRSDGSHLRFAIVGSELRGDSTFYWYEVVTTRGPDRFVGQLLVAGLFTATPDVRGLVTKAGNGPSIRVPDMLIVVVGRQIARSVASEVVRHCSNGEHCEGSPLGRFGDVSHRPRHGRQVVIGRAVAPLQLSSSSSRSRPCRRRSSHGRCRGLRCRRTFP